MGEGVVGMGVPAATSAKVVSVRCWKVVSESICWFKISFIIH